MADGLVAPRTGVPLVAANPARQLTIPTSALANRRATSLPFHCVGGTRAFARGRSDYDPKLGQFLTPDPLYFEDLERCLDSPLQCTLYGYAGGNPLSFVDPTGLGFLSFLANTLQVAGGFVIAATGAALCTTGAGCVVGGLAVAYGISVATAAAHDAVTGETRKHQVNVAIASVTSQQTAYEFDVVISAATIGNALSKSPYLIPRTPASVPPSTAPAVRPATAQPRGSNGVVLMVRVHRQLRLPQAEEDRPQALVQDKLQFEHNFSTPSEEPEAVSLVGAVGRRRPTRVTCMSGTEMCLLLRVATSPANVCLEGAACNLSAGNRGARALECRARSVAAAAPRMEGKDCIEYA